MASRIAINGFGRIGRQALRALMERHPEIEIIAVNDLGDAKTATHLFKYDSTYGRYPGTVSNTADSFTIDGRHVPETGRKHGQRSRAPARLPPVPSAAPSPPPRQ